MKILVFGASGRTGHEVVKQALQQGHLVTAFVRNPSKLKLTDPHLTVCHGDITDEKQVEKAIVSMDSVISTLGASSPFKYDQAVVDGFAHILQGMHANDVKRLIYMSFVGVKESRKNAGLVIRYIAPKLLSTEIKGHEQREKLIRNSSLDYTIVRPATLTNGQLTSKYRSGETISTKGFTAMISRADVAHFLVHELTDTIYLKKAPLIMY